jgi:hypothetical protein
VVFSLAGRSRRYTRWLYGYTGGFVELDPKTPPRVVRWDEITDAVDEWESGGESALRSYVGLRLTTAGQVVSITPPSLGSWPGDWWPAATAPPSNTAASTNDNEGSAVHGPSGLCTVGSMKPFTFQQADQPWPANTTLLHA